MKYKAILADPPWDFEVWSKDTGSGRSPSAHYDTMTLDDICALPISGLADDDCALFLWAVWPRLFDAQRVIEAWVFTYKTLAFDWVKVRRGLKLHFGMGYWTRANSEPLLLATRGKPKRKDAGIAQVIFDLEDYQPETIIAPFRGHSVKPDEQYTRIEKLVSGPYLELFSRRRREGWDAFGNQVENSIVLESV